jgi:phosphoserine phosphatase
LTHILTLIAGAAAPPLDDAGIEAVRTVLPEPGATRWLCEGEACDIAFRPDANAVNARIVDAVRGALQDAPIDIVSQCARNRRKRLLVADMDSTLIGQECIDEIAGYVGLKPKISTITERAMRGELEFESALRERVALLKGVDESDLQSIFDNQITLNPGARTLARTMGAHGATTVIVSGGFTFFTAHVAQGAGFDANHANILEILEGKLTGYVIEPILGQQAKLDALLRYRETLKLTADETLAVGDGANDLAMLMEAGLGVAFHAKPIVAAKAHACIDYCDLTALLFAQGYTRDEFVEN